MTDLPHALAFDAALPRHGWSWDVPATRSAEVVPLALPLKVGVISNPRSHRNKLQHGAQLGDLTDILHAAPRTPEALDRSLAEFAAEGVDLLAVDGGDGTVRDVITAAQRHFHGRFPRLAVVPSGKTNALALDLGTPKHATLPELIAAARANQFQPRVPIEVFREDAPDAVPLRGFLLGAGGFVRATGLAQRTHGWGAFNDLAVGLSLVWAVTQTFFAGADNPWRQGEPMRIDTADGQVIDGRQYLLFASTLERLPLGVRPLGPPRAGLKMLTVDAPPARMIRNVPRLLAGEMSARMERDGYRHSEPAILRLTMDGGFILDGELYEGGALTIRRGAPLHFIAP